MKSLRFALVASAAALYAILPLQLAAASTVKVAPAAEPVYVKIESNQMIWFEHYRYSEANGSEEIILSTLKQTAVDQARFAGYPGAVIVLDDGAKVPEGAPVLLLTWNGETVNATLIRGDRETSLGVVSRSSTSTHPDYANMRQFLDKGPHLERRDAVLRANTQMNLYVALRLLNRNQDKA